MMMDPCAHTSILRESFMTQFRAEWEETMAKGRAIERVPVGNDLALLIEVAPYSYLNRSHLSSIKMISYCIMAKSTQVTLYKI